MKLIKSFLFFVLLLFSVGARGQYTSENSFMRKALVVYHKNSKGFYQCDENVMVESVQNITSVYAYDKKANNLFVRTINGNYVITLNKDYAKFIKNNKQIPKLSEVEINKIVKAVNENLSKFYSEKNDSIKQAIKRMREKEIEDSIRNVEKQRREQEEIQKIQLAREQGFESYRKKFYYSIVPVNQMKLKCSVCNKTIATDYLKCSSIQNDSIYFRTSVTKELNDEYSEMHVAPISKELKTNPNFMYHIQAFKDSLCADSIFDKEFLDFYNNEEIYNHYARVKKIAPFGYMEDWGWDDEFSVSFHFDYVNINPKTIKYIDVYWKITNDVGDVRKTGHFKGTGPLKQYMSANWSWDSSSYYVAGDASNMEITKVILTYMNGTQKVLGKSQVHVNNTSNYTDEMETDDLSSYHYISSYSINNNGYVDSPAMYAKGAIELYNDIQSNLVYDHNIGKKAIVNSILKLEIKEDGTVGEIKVDESLSDKYDKMAIDAAKKLSNFIPATNEGEKVKVWFVLPVTFWFE